MNLVIKSVRFTFEQIYINNASDNYIKTLYSSSYNMNTTFEPSTGSGRKVLASMSLIHEALKNDVQLCFDDIQWDLSNTNL